MSESILHPTPERFEAYLDGSLAGADRAVLDSHVQSCVRCQGELEEWRALFAVLAGLPRLEPRPGFTERVLARVRIRQPWYARAAAWAASLLPQTTRGWALVATFLTLPTLAIGGATYWLLAQPWMTAEGLLVFVRQRAADAVLTLAGQAGSAVLETSAANRILGFGSTLAAQIGAGGLGALAALFGTLTIVSGWVLYTNLFRTPKRDSGYVSYCF